MQFGAQIPVLTAEIARANRFSMKVLCVEFAIRSSIFVGVQTLATLEPFRISSNHDSTNDRNANHM